MPRGRPRKSTPTEPAVTPTINSHLTLQIALKLEFAKRDLPELSVSHTNKAIYLSGPCGQQLCKVFYTGTTKLSASDFSIIFAQVIAFLDNHLDTLSKLFTLRKKLKEPNPKGVYFTSNATAGVGVYFDRNHKAYNKFIAQVYTDGIVFSGNLISEAELDNPALREAIKAQRAHLATYTDRNKIQAEVNQIITDLSNCTI